MSKTPEQPEVDPPATAEELEAARSLAEALQGTGGRASPELDTTALLRQAQPQAVDARVDERVLALVLPALKSRRAGGRRRPWWLWPAVLVPATAAVLLLALSTLHLSHSPRATAALPPSVALLETQASAARGQRQALATLETQMRQYRAEYFRAGGRQ